MALQEHDCLPLFAAGLSLTPASIRQPLRVIDPDHPLVALVRKAQQEKNSIAAAAAAAVAAAAAPVPTPTPAPAPPEEEVAQPVVPTQAEYTDRE